MGILNLIQFDILHAKGNGFCLTAVLQNSYPCQFSQRIKLKVNIHISAMIVLG